MGKIACNTVNIKDTLAKSVRESRPQSRDSNYQRHIDRMGQLDKYNGLSPLAHKHPARRHLKGNECKTTEIQSHPAGIEKQRAFETAMTLHNKSKNNQSTAQKKRDRNGYESQTK